MRDRERLPREPEEQPLPREVEPVADLLQLQRSAGNQAVASLLARQPTEEKAATMTAGLGDDIGVIPIDSFSWGSSGSPGGTGGKGHPEVHEVTISFVLNAAASAVSQAAAGGRHIDAAFISTQKMTIDFSDVVLTGYSQSDRVAVTLNFNGMKIRE